MSWPRTTLPVLAAAVSALLVATAFVCWWTAQAVVE
jgi:hypothetical protein